MDLMLLTAMARTKVRTRCATAEEKERFERNASKNKQPPKVQKLERVLGVLTFGSWPGSSTSLSVAWEISSVSRNVCATVSEHCYSSSADISTDPVAHNLDC